MARPEIRPEQTGTTGVFLCGAAVPAAAKSSQPEQSAASESGQTVLCVPGKNRAYNKTIRGSAQRHLSFVPVNKYRSSISLVVGP